MACTRNAEGQIRFACDATPVFDEKNLFHPCCYFAGGKTYLDVCNVAKLWLPPTQLRALLRLVELSLCLATQNWETIEQFATHEQPAAPRQVTLRIPALPIKASEQVLAKVFVVGGEAECLLDAMGHDSSCKGRG